MKTVTEQAVRTGPTMCMNHPGWPAEQAMAEYGPPLCDEVCWPGLDDPPAGGGMDPRLSAENGRVREGMNTERQCPVCPHGWDDHDAAGCTAIADGRMCWCQVPASPQPSPESGS